MKRESSSSNKSLSRSLVVAGVLTSSLFLASCSTGESATAEPQAQPSTSQTSSSASPEASPEVTKPALVGKVVEHPFGSFVQVELPDDSPAYTVDPTTFSNAEDYQNPTNLFSSEEIQSAQHFLVDWISTEGVNSVLNNATSLPDEEEKTLRNKWWEENKVKVHPLYQNDFYNDLSAVYNPDESAKQSGTFVQLDHWQQNRPEYKYVYGENESRIQNLAIKPQEVSAFESPDGAGNLIFFKFKVAYEVPVVIEGKSAEEDGPLPFPQYVYGEVLHTVSSDGQGGWQINGYSYDLKTYEAWSNDDAKAAYDSFRSAM